MVLNPSKCVFAQSSVTFLGFAVTEGGIQPPKDRIESLLNYPLPQIAEGLRRFIGMVNFYRRFLPHASEYTGPLHEAISKPNLKGAQLVP